MRMVLVAAAFALLAACDGTAENEAADNLAPQANATTPVSVNASAPAAPAPPALPSRVSGPPDPPGEYYSERGGISRPLSGAEGEGAAAGRKALINDLIGRWAFNCNTGAGELVFRRGGRFTAPGGSGRFEANGSSLEVVFTFADGETETWISSMSPGSLGLDRKGGGGDISRRLCSATP
jgi:hypothetical protein